MAKRSKIAKNEKRKAVVERYAARRAELKEIIRRPSSTEAERRPRSPNCVGSPATPAPPASATADSVDGRPRGHLRKFGLSRVRMREQAHAGFLPGVTKSSW
ncbi:Small ribosomal subunit protein uS14 OS=Streptomyces alboniger OX=132473 GN=rpsN PE=3 SV=1 [Streptomyces alboniger]